MTVMGAL